ncbi:hypothetical protein BH23CHL5_BH23CHL5_01050 [soil metagenome]
MVDDSGPDVECPDAEVVIRFPGFGNKALELVGLVFYETDESLVGSEYRHDRLVVVGRMRIEIRGRSVDRDDEQVFAFLVEIEDCAASCLGPAEMAPV